MKTKGTQQIRKFMNETPPELPKELEAKFVRQAKVLAKGHNFVVGLPDYGIEAHVSLGWDGSGVYSSIDTTILKLHLVGQASPKLQKLINAALADDMTLERLHRTIRRQLKADIRVKLNEVKDYLKSIGDAAKAYAFDYDRFENKIFAIAYTARKAIWSKGM